MTFWTGTILIWMVGRSDLLEKHWGKARSHVNIKIEYIAMNAFTVELVFSFNGKRS